MMYSVKCRKYYVLKLRLWMRFFDKPRMTMNLNIEKDE